MQEDIHEEEKSTRWTQKEEEKEDEEEAGQIGLVEGEQTTGARMCSHRWRF